MKTWSDNWGTSPDLLHRCAFIAWTERTLDVQTDSTRNTLAPMYTADSVTTMLPAWPNYGTVPAASIFAHMGIERANHNWRPLSSQDPQSFELWPGCTAAAWPSTHRHTAMPPPYALEAPASIMCSLRPDGQGGGFAWCTTTGTSIYTLTLPVELRYRVFTC
jgi:hypothetical protein